METRPESPSPSPQPGPDTVVDIQAPQDGVDGINAVTVNQGLAALANEAAWEKKPTGATPASPGTLDTAYAQPIKAFRNVRGLRRALFDHRGYMLPRITQWQENWDDAGFPIKTTGGPDVYWWKRWLTTIVAGSASPQIFTMDGGLWPAGPGTPPYVTGTLVLDTQANPGPSACTMLVEAATKAGCLVTDDTDVVFQADSIELSGETCFGISPGVSGATAAFESTNPEAVCILSGRGGATHIELYTCISGSSPTFTSLGAAGDASSRWRIELVGVNAMDDSNARVLVYGDGDLTKPLANVAIDFAPTNPADRVFWSPFFRYFGNAGRQISRFGTTDFAFARFPGDVGMI